MTVRDTSERLIMTVLRIIRSAVLWCSAVVGVISILAFAVVMLFGLKPAVVISGSMEPTLPVGSLILTKATAASQVDVGAIVTVPRDDGTLVTHRVVDIDRPDDGPFALTLRGDANESNDAAPYLVTEAGTHVLTIPVLGHIAMAVRTPIGLLAIIGGLICVFLLSYWTPRLPVPQHEPAPVAVR